MNNQQNFSKYSFKNQQIRKIISQFAPKTEDIANNKGIVTPSHQSLPLPLWWRPPLPRAAATAPRCHCCPAWRRCGGPSVAPGDKNPIIY